jgi:hypothetical protein
MLEIWQADAQGRFSDPQDKRALPNSSFRGFGRCGTDANGGYAFDTIKPGSGARSRRQAAGAAYSARDVRARHAAASLHADLFRRRGRQCRRSRAGAGAGRPPRHADRDAPARAAMRSIVSTSACRATTRRCFSTCEAGPSASWPGKFTQSAQRRLLHPGMTKRKAAIRSSTRSPRVPRQRLLAQRGLGRADHDRQRDRASVKSITIW